MQHNITLQNYVILLEYLFSRTRNKYFRVYTLYDMLNLHFRYLAIYINKHLIGINNVVRIK